MESQYRKNIKLLVKREKQQKERMYITYAMKTIDFFPSLMNYS